MQELVTNIWIFIDLETELAYNWSGRVYSINGTDEEKLMILKKLSSTDYLTVPRNEFPENVVAVIDGKELKGKLPSNMVRNFFDQNPDLFFNKLENDLPPLLNLDYQNMSKSKQKIPQNPLYVITQIYEEEDGNLHPIVTLDDQNWLNEKRFYKFR
jgi:hypothetical protein